MITVSTYCSVNAREKNVFLATIFMACSFICIFQICHVFVIIFKHIVFIILYVFNLRAKKCFFNFFPAFIIRDYSDFHFVFW